MLIVLLAVLGPLLAPHGQNEVVGTPFSSKGFLGTDYLGQDVSVAAAVRRPDRSC